MIYRLADWPTGVPLHTDVCIVGSGAAGLTLARELLGTGARALILESGDERRTQAADDMNIAEAAGLPHRGATAGRARVFGGATTAWGGQLLPLRHMEFAPRAWVPHTGWLVGAGTLAPYYARVEQMLGMPGPPYDAHAHEVLGLRPPRFDAELLSTRFSQWIPLMRRNLALDLRKPLSSARDVHLMLGATVVNLRANPRRDQLQELEVCAGPDRMYRVRARHYVLCVGGIETPRLLLSAGLANSSGTLGRYFQDHISYVAARCDPAARDRIRRYFEPRYRAGVMYSCKIEPSDALQQRLGLLNCMAHVKFEIPRALGLLEAREMLRALQSGRTPVPSWSAMRALLGGVGELTRIAFARWMRSRRAAPSRGETYLLVDVEQAPNPDSRITLAGDVDALGLPRARIDWRIGDLEQRSVARFLEVMRAQWQAAGLGALAPADGMRFEDGETLGAARDIYHHMGTARMSADARAGVVNPQLRCHDVHNLYIASAAVFPSGGIANPTFTVMALAARLADHLKQAAAAPVLVAG